MSFTNASSTLSNPNISAKVDPPLQSTLKTYQTTNSMVAENLTEFSKIQTKSKILKDIKESDFEEILDDPDIMIYEPNKKARVENQNVNMLASNNKNLNNAVYDETYKKKEIIQQKAAQANSLPNHVITDGKKPGKDGNEISSSYNSNFPFSGKFSGKEVIDLEDDSKSQDSIKNLVNDQFSEPLAVVDDVTDSIFRAKENMLQQVILSSLISQPDLTMQRQQQIDSQQGNLLLNQLIQLSQLNQLNQRGFLNQMNNAPFYNRNQEMLFNMNYNNTLNQNHFPFSGLQDMSSLGKRSEPYDIFNTLRLMSGEAATRGRSEVIILDDEEEISTVVNKASKTNKSSYRFPKDPKAKIFRIIKTLKRPPPKKPQVFTVIRYKKRPFPTQSYQSSPSEKSEIKPIVLQKKTVTDEHIDEYVINRTIKGSVFTIFKVIIIPENKRRTSRRLRSDKVVEHQELLHGQKIRVIRSHESHYMENYVIKLHVNEDEENEDVIETPIGLGFQVKLLPFSMGSGFRKEMKFVWDPEDEEGKEEYFNRLETQFEKKIENQEIALKTWKKFNMDVDKVIEELENNKMTFKSFFEVRKKVLRSLVVQQI